MKKHIFICLAVFITMSSCGQEKGYTLKIKMNHFQKTYTPCITYSYSRDRLISDTISDTNYVTEDGWMVFRGKVKEPVAATLTLLRDPATLIKTAKDSIAAPPLQFFLSNDEITITGDAEMPYMAKVTGGEANKDLNIIRPMLAKMDHENWTALKEAYAKSPKDGYNLEAFKVFSQTREANYHKAHQLKLDFIAKHPASLASMNFLFEMKYLLHSEELKSAYDRLSDTYKNNAIAKGIAATIHSTEATEVGKPAIPFHKKDMNGNMVNLASLKGKYVLLDFWGTWCVPCRQSHPHLKALYAKYKADGFEIVGIAQEVKHSEEENRKLWLKAIKTDGINWIQILNNEDIATSDVVKAYGVTTFPTKILLDKEGKIIARYNGEGNDIDAELKKIFGK